MSAARSAGEPLLVVVSPAALTLDGESVRVARDVLGAAFAVKVAVPRSRSELERTLARRGGKRLVVIGDDRALHQVVQVLHEHAELASGPVGIIPVGKREKVVLSRSLGAAPRSVEAARAIVHGSERSLGLLVDERGGVILGELRIPGRAGPGQTPGTGTERPRDAVAADRRGAASATSRGGRPGADERSLRANSAPAGRGLPTSARPGWGTQLGRTARTLAEQLLGCGGGPGQALRVEADGQVLAELGRPVSLVAAWDGSLPTAASSLPGQRRTLPKGSPESDADRDADPGAPTGAADAVPAPRDGELMQILLSTRSLTGSPLRVHAQQVTVTGSRSTGFTYEADDTAVGPVQQRTWTVEPAAWRLTVAAPARSGG